MEEQPETNPNVDSTAPNKPETTKPAAPFNPPPPPRNIPRITASSSNNDDEFEIHIKITIRSGGKSRTVQPGLGGSQFGTCDGSLCNGSCGTCESCGTCNSCTGTCGGSCPLTCGSCLSCTNCGTCAETCPSTCSGRTCNHENTCDSTCDCQ